MNNDQVQKKIKSIKIDNIIHSIIHLLLDIIHILAFYYTYFITDLEKNIFYAEIFIICFFTIIPLTINIFFSYLKLTKKFLERLKAILKFLFYLFFLNGLIISINTWNNAKILSNFYYDCPFSYNVKDISTIFENLDSKKDIENKCNYNRCFLIDYKDNKSKNDYLCNMKGNINVDNCSIYIFNTKNLNEELAKYIDYCSKYTTMYKCEKKHDFNLYRLSHNYKCPNKSDIYFSYAFAFIFIFIDSLLFSMPWLLKYFSIGDLIILLYREINNPNQSLNETSHTSKIENNSNNNNSLNFEKQPTRTIIIDNKMNNNINISNSNISKNDAEILSINKSIEIKNNQNILSNKEQNNENNNIENNVENEKSKSENILINNGNQNIFKIFNQKIK